MANDLGYTTVLFGEPDMAKYVSSYSLFVAKTCKNCYLTTHHHVPFPKRGCRP